MFFFQSDSILLAFFSIFNYNLCAKKESTIQKRHLSGMNKEMCLHDNGATTVSDSLETLPLKSCHCVMENKGGCTVPCRADAMEHTAKVPYSYPKARHLLPVDIMKVFEGKSRKRVDFLVILKASQPPLGWPLPLESSSTLNLYEILQWFEWWTYVIFFSFLAERTCKIYLKTHPKASPQYCGWPLSSGSFAGVEIQHDVSWDTHDKHTKLLKKKLYRLH